LVLAREGGSASLSRRLVLEALEHQLGVLPAEAGDFFERGPEVVGEPKGGRLKAVLRVAGNEGHRDRFAVGEMALRAKEPEALGSARGELVDEFVARAGETAEDGKLPVFALVPALGR
jgi:hypothetical protein